MSKKNAGGVTEKEVEVFVWRVFKYVATPVIVALALWAVCSLVDATAPTIKGWVTIEKVVYKSKEEVISSHIHWTTAR